MVCDPIQARNIHAPSSDWRSSRLNDVILPDASTRSFWLNGSAWEYPNFENAETFVKRFADRGFVTADPLVVDAMGDSEAEISRRTSQRRFLRTTGMTRSTVHQIERARAATLRLPDFRNLAKQKGFTQDGKLADGVKAGMIVNWLMTDFQLGHGHAMAIVALLSGSKCEDGV